MTRLAVFDCDGTLVDSQVNIINAMRVAFAAVGHPAPDDHAIRHIVGLSLFETMATLVPDGDAALHAALADEYRGAFHRLRADGTLAAEPLYPGIRDLLPTLETRGWLLGVATGKSDRGLALILAHHDIAHHFVTLQTADRHPSKPHPAMLELAMAQAGATPAETVMIGDTGFDMAMARAAGARAIGVDWGYHPPEALRVAGAEAVVGSTDALLALLA
ncbi:MAG: HAD-IA family hydrolase [Sphingomonadaceae bacterium]|nr:HAD-IA family hydrolase [Sphingomonadaceae bacterium]